jgi:aminopeptidase
MVENTFSPELLGKMQFGAEQAVFVCAKVQPNENVILVQDESSNKITPFLHDQIKKADGRLEILEIQNFGTRPLDKESAQKLVNKISEADVAFVCSQYKQEEFSSFLKPVTDLTDIYSLRLAMMFDLNEKLLSQGMNADYEEIKKFNQKLLAIVENSKEIKVRTKGGTDFVVETGYKWISFDGIPEPGKWVNLPDGEILTAQKNFNGKVVIDGVVEEFDNPKYGLLNKYPVEFEVRNGLIIIDSVKCSNQELLENIVVSLGLDENSNRIGEFAFGTNLYLKSLIGNLTQDEKFPSVHIAWGDPYGFKTGADWTSVQHRDAVMLSATVEVDGRRIMNEGVYQI